MKKSLFKTTFASIEVTVIIKICLIFAPVLNFYFVSFKEWTRFWIWVNDSVKVVSFVSHFNSRCEQSYQLTVNFHMNGRFVDHFSVTVPNARTRQLILIRRMINWTYDWIELEFTNTIDINEVEIKLLMDFFI